MRTEPGLSPLIRLLQPCSRNLEGARSLGAAPTDKSFIWLGHGWFDCWRCLFVPRLRGTAALQVNCGFEALFQSSPFPLRTAAYRCVPLREGLSTGFQAVAGSSSLTKYVTVISNVGTKQRILPSSSHHGAKFPDHIGEPFGDLAERAMLDCFDQLFKNVLVAFHDFG